MPIPQGPAQIASTTITTYTFQPYENRIMTRALKFGEAWKAYQGNLPNSLKIRKDAPDDNVKINACKVIIDKGMSFLFGHEIHFNLDKDDSKDSPEEEWLEKCWSFNHKQAFLQKLAMTGGVCGHVFVQIIPQKPFPRLVSIDPAIVDVTCRPDDVSIVLCYTIQFKIELPSGNTTDFRKRIEAIEIGDPSPLYRDSQLRDEDQEYTDMFMLPDDGTTIKRHWQIVEEKRDPGDKEWILVRVIPWLYSWPPIADCQNLPMPHNYWGLADIEEDIIHLNKAMNFVLSNTNRIVRYHAHPRPWIKGASPDQLKQAIDETLVLPSVESAVGLLEMQPGGIEPSTMHYKNLKNAMHEVSRIPQISVSQLDNLTTLSGIAMQIMYQPLVEKTGQKRTFYGALLCELSRRMLVLADMLDDNETEEPSDSDGNNDSDPSPIRISWPEILPQDDLEHRQALSIDANLGIVSTETISDKLGYDFQTEQERRHNGEFQIPNIINALIPTMFDANKMGEQVTPGAGPAAKNDPGSGGEGQVATPPKQGGSALAKNTKQKIVGTRGPRKPPATRR